MYKSAEKEYTQSTATSDIIVGVQSERENGDSRINFYFIPTLYIEKLGQKSISVNKAGKAKNQWGILEKCKDEEFVKTFFNLPG